MFQFIKVTIGVGILAGIIYGVLFVISPTVSVEILNPQMSYENPATFRTTIHNLSPFPKKINSPTPELSVDILFDGAEPLKSTAKPEYEITLAPFSREVVEHTVTMIKIENGNKDPQVLRGDASEIELIDGQHKFKASWDGRTSFEQSFGIR